MPRVKRGVTARARHKKVLKQAKGYYGARSRVYRVAKQAVIKAGQYAYRDRRQRKRQFRALWIVRINAAAREFGLSYSRMIAGLNKASVAIDQGSGRSRRAGQGSLRRTRQNRSGLTWAPCRSAGRCLAATVYSTHTYRRQGRS
jgi:large subunit ribosomal protein L20